MPETSELHGTPCIVSCFPKLSLLSIGVDVVGQQQQKYVLFNWEENENCVELYLAYLFIKNHCFVIIVNLLMALQVYIVWELRRELLRNLYYLYSWTM